MTMSDDQQSVLVTALFGGGPKVLRYDRDGVLLNTYALSGGTGTLGTVNSIVDRGSDFLVSERVGNEVYRYDQNGNLLGGGPFITTPGGLYDMAEAPNGDILLARSLAQQVLRYQANGSPHGTQPVAQSGYPGGFDPRSITVDAAGNLYSTFSDGSGRTMVSLLSGGIYQPEVDYADNANYESLAFAPPAPLADGELYTTATLEDGGRRVFRLNGGPNSDVLFYNPGQAGGEGVAITWVFPEPASLALLGLGGLVMLKRNRA